VQGKQAKIVSPTQERAILGYLATTRYPHRDRVIWLFAKSEARAKSCHTKPKCAFAYCVHFVDQTPSAGSA
jgi:hypothetical protein